MDGPLRVEFLRQSGNGRMTLVRDGSEILPAPQKRVQLSPPHQPKTALRPAPCRSHILAAIEIAIDGQRDSR